MKKITQQAIEAFNTGHNFNSSNTEVKVYNNGIHSDERYLYLHGNCIAKRKHNVLSVTNAGLKTNTTKERLNGLPTISISQRAGQWYLNGNLWNGEWVDIN